MLDSYLPKVSIYVCQKHGAQRHPNMIKDEYGDMRCAHCEAETTFLRAEPSTWVSIAIYECSRAYGGPEEGGWYYDEGAILPETLRCFEAGDFPQAELYVDLLKMRWQNDPYSSIKYYVRVHSEEIVKRFPAITPRYC